MGNVRTIVHNTTAYSKSCGLFFPKELVINKVRKKAWDFFDLSENGLNPTYALKKILSLCLCAYSRFM